MIVGTLLIIVGIYLLHLIFDKDYDFPFSGMLFHFFGGIFLNISGIVIIFSVFSEKHFEENYKPELKKTLKEEHYNSINRLCENDEKCWRYERAIRSGYYPYKKRYGKSYKNCYSKNGYEFCD